MNTLGNLAIGAALAAVLLAPAAGSDANRVVNGNPVAVASLGGATGNIACDIEHALSVARTTLPRLLAEATVRSSGPQAEAR